MVLTSFYKSYKYLPGFFNINEHCISRLFQKIPLANRTFKIIADVLLVLSFALQPKISVTEKQQRFPSSRAIPEFTTNLYMSMRYPVKPLIEKLNL